MECLISSFVQILREQPKIRKQDSYSSHDTHTYDILYKWWPSLYSHVENKAHATYIRDIDYGLIDVLFRRFIGIFHCIIII